jgi:hypothetical protein
MNKLNKESVTEYFECGCHDIEHVLRAWWDDDFGLNFEFLLSKMPLTWDAQRVWRCRWIDKLRYPFVRIRQYFKTIWWAIKGRPIWFTAYNSLDRREMKRLIKFIQYCLDRKNKTK